MATEHSHNSHPGMTHAEWLRYSNQGATRNDPLDPRLIDAMSFLGGMGITMDVISGGQEAAGTPGAQRTGSTRHDHGNAADVDFYMGGRKLDWNNPADMPILVEIVQTAKSRGVTGIGAGDDYMGPGRFHVGFGNPGVWGADGKSANAPEWLVAAYNGVPLGDIPAGTYGPTSAPVAGPAYANTSPGPQQPNALAPQPFVPQTAMLDVRDFLTTRPNALAAVQPIVGQRTNFLSGRV
jgi:hypothetical protein